MKKVLSVILAIMMLFGALSVGASAANIPSKEVTQPILNSGNLIVIYNFGDGTSYRMQPVYYATEEQNNGFVMENVTGTYYLLPGAVEGGEITVGTRVFALEVTPASGSAFQGWDCSVTGERISEGKSFVITEEMYTIAKEVNHGIIYMDAAYRASEPEEDTMATVLGVLMKVFGTIVGILFLDGNSAAGVELMEKLLGGIF